MVLFLPLFLDFAALLRCSHSSAFELAPAFHCLWLSLASSLVSSVRNELLVFANIWPWDSIRPAAGLAPDSHVSLLWTTPRSGFQPLGLFNQLHYSLCAYQMPLGPAFSISQPGTTTLSAKRIMTRPHTVTDWESGSCANLLRHDLGFQVLGLLVKWPVREWMPCSAAPQHLTTAVAPPRLLPE
jgi:hypothetical protein